MSPLMAVTALVVLFAGASLLADTLRPRWRPVPLLILGAGVFAVLLELTRWDHGLTDAYWMLSLVVAPIVLIFGGAAWGTRRFYGWPDLGHHPSRAAFVALCMLLGVLVGKQLHEDDVRASQRRAESVRAAVIAWRNAHEGTYPANLADAIDPVPSTALGALAPPPLAYGRDQAGRPLLAIPLRADAWLALDLDSGAWALRRSAPRPFGATP